MNDKDYLENIIFDGLDGVPKEKKPDVFRPIIAAVTAFLLLFGIILALTIALIDSNPTPKLNPSDNSGTTPPSISETIPENRERVEVNNAKNAETSVTAYRPTDVSGCKNLVYDSSITSKAALLEDLDAGVVIAAKNADERVQIASMTKVMTLIVACDLIKDYYEVITLKNDARLLNYSKAFLNANIETEKVYYIDALYGLILPSGADCAYGIAESLCDTEEKFVEKMNEKAASLGMTGTHFSNCVGKDDGGNNYSTMRDVATMFAYALKNELCYKILTTHNWKCIGKYKMYSNKGIESIVISGFSKEDKNLTFGNIKALGGKSGREDIAQYCLVSLGETSDGRRYICVTAGHQSSSYKDTAYIYRNYVK